MNISFLETFLEVVRLGNLSEAAKVLGLSQPGVTLQIQRLEREVALRLLDRTERGVNLTRAGQRFLRFAETVVEEQRRLLRDLDEMRHEVSGTLRIGAGTIPGEFLLPVMLSEFRERYPAASAVVTVGPSLIILDRVRSGDLELGFTGTPPETPDLSAFAVDGDEIVLIVPPDHPFARRKSVDLEELRGECFVLREDTSGTQQRLEALLDERSFDIRACRVSLTLGSSQAVVSAVEAGLGIAFVSNLAAARSEALARVNVVPLEGLRLQRKFYCVYRQDRLSSRLEREFLNFVRARAAAP